MQLFLYLMHVHLMHQSMVSTLTPMAKQGADSTVRINADTHIQQATYIRPVTELALMPYCGVQLTNDTIESPYSSVALHPDGQILGTGTDQGVVHVWETKSQNVGCSVPLLLLLWVSAVHVCRWPCVFAVC